MKDIVIYGAGGFGRETALLIQQINERTPQWNLVGFFDDGLAPDTSVDDLPVLGGKEAAKKFKGAIAVAVAEPGVRESIVSGLRTSKIDFPVLTHPNTLLGSKKFNRIDEGSIICAGVILTTQVQLGAFTIINLDTTVGHDVVTGAFTTVMPGCSISGNVKIGKGSVLGTGSRIIQNLEIGENCVVGAGAVVTHSFGNSVKVIGVPAREIKKN